MRGGHLPSKRPQVSPRVVDVERVDVRRDGAISSTPRGVRDGPPAATRIENHPAGHRLFPRLRGLGGPADDGRVEHRVDGGGGDGGLRSRAVIIGFPVPVALGVRAGRRERGETETVPGCRLDHHESKRASFTVDRLGRVRVFESREHAVCEAAAPRADDVAEVGVQVGGGDTIGVSRDAIVVERDGNVAEGIFDG